MCIVECSNQYRQWTIKVVGGESDLYNIWNKFHDKFSLGYASQGFQQPDIVDNIVIHPQRLKLIEFKGPAMIIQGIIDYHNNLCPTNEVDNEESRSPITTYPKTNTGIDYRSYEEHSEHVSKRIFATEKSN